METFFSNGNVTSTLSKIAFLVSITQEEKEILSNFLSTSFILLLHHTLEILDISSEFES